MQFHFTEEQQAFADSVRRFALAHLEKGALKRAHDPRYPFDVAKLMSAQGLMGISLPEADGGQGGTLMDAVIAIEQVAAVCPRSSDVVQFGNFGPIRTFAEYGTPQQKARWLPDLLQGRMVMSLGITEPDAGSAATDLKTSAKPDGSHYVINGSKLFSSFSPDAAIFLIYVRYGPGLGGIGSVIVERGAPGFAIGQPSRFMSGEEWCELHFDNCRIPAENVLLGPGGFKKQMAGFNIERLGNTARSLAFGRYAFNKAREHCNGNSPTWRSSSKARSFCSTARRPMPTAVCPPPTKPPSPRPPATRRASRLRAKRSRSWAPLAIARRAWWNGACGVAAAG